MFHKKINYMKNHFSNKKNFKRRSRECQICGENNYKLLDVHRIKWGGKYSFDNCVSLCTNCHRKVHSGIIEIKGWKHSSIGRILHFIENNEEKFK